MKSNLATVVGKSRIVPAHAHADSGGGGYDRKAEVRVLFKSLDVDGSGSINASELHALMKTVGVQATVADVAALLADVDTDGSGDISLAEFTAVMDRRVELPFSAAEVKEAFAVLAGVGAPPGLISAATVRNLMLRAGPLYLPGPAPVVPSSGGPGGSRSGPGGRSGGGGSSSSRGDPRSTSRGKTPAGAGKKGAKALPPMPSRGVPPPAGTPELTPARVDALISALTPDAAGMCDYAAFVASLMPEALP
jgi:Ca2+-binding EF-hand superfamily protein